MKKDDITIKLADCDFDRKIPYEKLFVGKPNLHNIDLKKRIIVPSNIRDSLPKLEGKEVVYFVPSVSKYVIGRLYHPEVYELMAIESFKKSKRLFSRSIRFELDNQGRANLSDYVDGYESILFIPQGDCVVLNGIEKRK